MNHDDVLHLKNMQDAVSAIKLHREKSVPEDVLRRAVLMEVIVFGEAAAQLTQKLKQQYPDIPWRMIIDSRNRLLHGYYDIDYAIMWSIVDEHIPLLEPKLRHIINELEAEHG